MSGNPTEITAEQLEGLNALSVKEVPAENLEKVSDTKIVQRIDFALIYRVKGYKGLWSPINKVNESGMIPMYRFGMSGKTMITQVVNLECLDGFYLYRKDGTAIKMADAFENLDKRDKDKCHTDEEMLELINPGYDENRFKVYHAKKIVEWYKEVKACMDEFEEQKKAKELAKEIITGQIEKALKEELVKNADKTFLPSDGNELKDTIKL